MSSEGLMTKIDEVEVESKYKAEKEIMNAVQVSDDDIIQLNVGGMKMTTTRSTLCQVEGSLLASMFSGRLESGLVRDKKGYVFLDFNPQNFVLILDYLRTKKIAGPNKPGPLPKVPKDQVDNFNNLVEYLGLSDEIIPDSEIVSGEIFKLHSAGITLEEGGKVAVHCHASNLGHQYVLGENVYQQGIVHLKLKLESFYNNHWMMVGMVKGDFVPKPKDIASYKWPGSYGWSLGEEGQVYMNGFVSRDNLLKSISRQGDTVELVLDCDAANLSLYLPTGQQFYICLPKSQTWRLHVNLLYSNDKIRVI